MEDKKKFLLKLQIAFVFLAIAGGMLNILVMSDNGGKMPLRSDYTGNYNGDIYFIIEDKEDVNFYYLADIFKIKEVYFSLGDVLMVFSFIGACLNASYYFSQYGYKKREDK